MNFQFYHKKKQIDDMIYLIMQGQGKARMSRTGGSKDTYYWNLVSISNAEMPITNDLSKGGAYNRIIQIGAVNAIFGNLGICQILLIVLKKIMASVQVYF